MLAEEEELGSNLLQVAQSVLGGLGVSGSFAEWLEAASNALTAQVANLRPRPDRGRSGPASRRAWALLPWLKAG